MDKQIEEMGVDISIAWQKANQRRSTMSITRPPLCDVLAEELAKMGYRKILENCEENADLKNQVHRLSECLEDTSTKSMEKDSKNAELQKQVDELTEENKALAVVIDSYKDGAFSSRQIVDALNNFYRPIVEEEKEKTDNAVKDTAKEILTEIDDLTLCIIDGSNDFEKGYFQAITDMKTAVKDLLKEKYGVEVK